MLFIRIAWKPLRTLNFSLIPQPVVLPRSLSLMNHAVFMEALLLLRRVTAPDEGGSNMPLPPGANTCSIVCR